MVRAGHPGVRRDHHHGVQQVDATGRVEDDEAPDLRLGGRDPQVAGGPIPDADPPPNDLDPLGPTRG
jgi:hypothetical protein